MPAAIAPRSAAGTIFDPGNPAAGEELVQVGGRSARAGTGTGRRTWCGNGAASGRAGGRRPLRRSTGRGWSGRSSSSRRGSLAKPSSFKIAAMAAGLSESPSRARARLMSWTERFCFRRATTCSPQPILLAGRSAVSCGRDEEVALGLIAKFMDEDAKAAGRVTESSGDFGGRDTVDEEGPEGFVLPMGGVGGLQEAAGQR